ncbi:MAG: hypothetical protein MUD10_01430 [Candidatus Pacebacteria bacterium]|jgi:hypothetical protein|nr:hypothetical protein [Candidatus Paceibacterota bacterium]
MLSLFDLRALFQKGVLLMDAKVKEVSIQSDAVRLIAAILAEMEPDERMLLRLTQRKGDLVKTFEELSLPPHSSMQRRITEKGYPFGFGVLPVATQMANLIRCFPQLKIPEYTPKAIGKALPRRADGNLVIPRPELIGGDYAESTHKMIQALGLACGGLQLWAGYGKQTISPTAEYQEFISCLEAEQTGDFLVFPGQLGRLRAGWGVDYFDRARMEYEYPLGTYAVVASLLANGGLLGPGAQLGLICAGDNLPTRKKKIETLAPTFFRLKDRITMGTLSRKYGLSEMGIPSGFLII